MPKTIDIRERLLMTVSLSLLVVFLAAMHVPGAARSDLCVTLTNGQAVPDAMCLAICCTAGVAALATIAALWSGRRAG